MTCTGKKTKLVDTVNVWKTCEPRFLYCWLITCVAINSGQIIVKRFVKDIQKYGSLEFGNMFMFATAQVFDNNCHLNYQPVLFHRQDQSCKDII